MMVFIDKNHFGCALKVQAGFLNRPFMHIHLSPVHVKCCQRCLLLPGLNWKHAFFFIQLTLSSVTATSYAHVTTIQLNLTGEPSTVGVPSHKIVPG